MGLKYGSNVLDKVKEKQNNLDSIYLPIAAHC